MSSSGLSTTLASPTVGLGGSFRSRDAHFPTLLFFRTGHLYLIDAYPAPTEVNTGAAWRPAPRVVGRE